ncbi:AAA family ATPase [Hoyosella subflava]|uniref:ATP-dependent protease ATP-binding subunit-like protein n=1 Tax=Hoyosella subflava (strain DSM 45089 / JCM 17490 / NBRC 109087 / DQS3-9A1) TaxID=443218 RepID=F6ES80_HOYSD|nr:AAA family ATPase [Hoyosella subflava]AEF42084.1 ATP-dependent protease ATP-binding subunit-like protein [Hoyosella subflava DQS3-9A1]
MPFLTDMFHENNKNHPTDSAGGSGPRADVPASHPSRGINNGGFSPDVLTARLGERIIGQDAAIAAVVRAVTLAQCGLCDPARPLANILLVGPTGVGKTELVRRVAAELRSGPDDLCRIDMNALAQEHYAASFSGAPPGYAGSKESFTLFDKGSIEGDPYTPGIVLFDEIEKADRTVLRALLQILDSGVLHLANGERTISFRNSYIFMTSNLGSRSISQSRRRIASRFGLARDGATVVRRELERFFDPEFFNRIDETVILREFTHETAMRVTRLELDLLSQRLARRSVVLTTSPAAVSTLADRGFDPVYGARGLRRAIRELVSAPLARELVRVRPVGTKPVTAAVNATGKALHVQVS